MSKMRFCFYHYEKTRHPKFYDKACELLGKAKACAFLNQKEVDIFADMVKKALDENKPAGHPSRLLHRKSSDGGHISIWSGNVEDVIARLYYSNISRILEYDQAVDDFFDVSERYEEGGGV